LLLKSGKEWAAGATWKKLFHKSLSGSPAILMHSGKKRGEFLPLPLCIIEGITTYKCGNNMQLSFERKKD